MQTSGAFCVKLCVDSRLKPFMHKYRKSHSIHLIILIKLCVHVIQMNKSPPLWKRAHMLHFRKLMSKVSVNILILVPTLLLI